MSSVFMSHNVIAFIQQLLLVFSALLSCNSVFMLCSQDFFSCGVRFFIRINRSIKALHCMISVEIFVLDKCPILVRTLVQDKWEWQSRHHHQRKKFTHTCVWCTKMDCPVNLKSQRLLRGWQTYALILDLRFLIRQCTNLWRDWRVRVVCGARSKVSTCIKDLIACGDGLNGC